MKKQDDQKVGEFYLVNREKLDRAINGTITDGGKLKGGVGPDASDAEVLAEYDKLGGLIKKAGLKVKLGCFWDSATKKAFKDPEPLFEVSFEGSIVEVDEEEAGALESARKKKEELKAKLKGKQKVKKLRRKKKVEKPENEPEEESEGEK